MTQRVESCYLKGLHSSAAARRRYCFDYSLILLALESSTVWTCLFTILFYHNVSRNNQIMLIIHLTWRTIMVIHTTLRCKRFIHSFYLIFTMVSLRCTDSKVLSFTPWMRNPPLQVPLQMSSPNHIGFVEFTMHLTLTTQRSTRFFGFGNPKSTDKT